ncbi:hypothetical protein CERSUDRAFT_95966 [Gelatoporia subvermispora B]|uniref:Uncharacterized protein n=1 Tax=Ceriporiopsis subvermispora (strain B) TaxID=914234 RepID=M2RAC3_CERS8|nr:hypothetical protein CERSUDRAFT_95966 [Gelatoporia subvermispora B]
MSSESTSLTETLHAESAPQSPITDSEATVSVENVPRYGLRSRVKRTAPPDDVTNVTEPAQKKAKLDIESEPPKSSETQRPSAPRPRKKAPSRPRPRAPRKKTAANATPVEASAEPDVQQASVPPTEPAAPTPAAALSAPVAESIPPTACPPPPQANEEAISMPDEEMVRAAWILLGMRHASETVAALALLELRYGVQQPSVATT